MTDIHIDKIVVNVIDPSLAQKVDEIHDMLFVLSQKENIMAATAQNILDKVAEVKTVEDSVYTLLDLVHGQLVELKANNDPAKLDEALAMLETVRQGGADAVLRNT